MIENPTKQIIHPDSLISSIEISRDTIALGHNKAFVEDGWGPISRPFPLLVQREYKVVRVLMENTYSFDEYITSSTQILDYWPRPSVSNSTIHFNDTIQFIYINSTGQYTASKFDFFDYTPFDSISYFDSINNLVKTRGFYYKFIEGYIDVALPLSSGTATNETLIEDPTLIPNIWFPINPFNDTAKMLFSIYISDTSLTSIYDFICDSANASYDQFLNIDNENIVENISIYPNPTYDEFTLDIGENSISNSLLIIFSLTGQKIMTKEFSKDKTTIDITHLTSGIYVLNYYSDTLNKSFKIIKQ